MFSLIVPLIHVKPFSLLFNEYTVSSPSNRSQQSSNHGVNKLTPIDPDIHVLKRERSSQNRDENAVQCKG